MTPVVPANAMVGTLGGYRFGDFAKMGLPLVILVMALAITLVPWLYPF
jgi:di/tricarboxylate transporter